MHFPRLRARREGGADIDYAPAPEDSFEFGLILDGLEFELVGQETI